MDKAQLEQSRKALFSEYDFTVLIDTSGSMGTVDPSTGGRTRMKAAEETVMTLVRDISEIDADGIDVVLFGNSKATTFSGVTADKVQEVFSANTPRGGTPLHLGLEEALKVAGKSPKKDVIIVITDGVPDSQAMAQEVIKRAANEQANGEDLTILFLQVGNDADATRYLRTLDDAIPGAKFDIVDAKTIDEVNAFDTTTELIAHAILD